MMVISITVPASVTTGQVFLLQVLCVEIPTEYVRYCGAFACGQDLVLP